MTDHALTIAINDRALRQHKTGVGHYVQELMTWLPRVAPQHRYYGFVADVLHHRPAARVGEVVPPRRLPWWVRRVVQRAYSIAFRMTARTKGAAVYHEPNNIALPSRLVTVTTVHDMSVVRHPEWHPADRVRWYEHDFERSVRSTCRFICPSTFSKNELVALAGVAAERVTVIPLAPRESFRVRPAYIIEQLRTRLGIPTSFFLFVGTVEPRKNIGATLAAYAGLPPSVRNHYPMVLAGPAGWGAPSLWEQARALGIESTVFPVGYVSDEDLAALYTAARSLIWPSWYEGFGLPPLECMACHTPVITSNAASLPEVVGDAALLVDPADHAGLTEAMRRVAEDDTLVAALAEKGAARAAQFTWQRCAAAHADIYVQAVQSG